jgi:hypothetical protein
MALCMNFESWMETAVSDAEDIYVLNELMPFRPLILRMKLKKIILNFLELYYNIMKDDDDGRQGTI